MKIASTALGQLCVMVLAACTPACTRSEPRMRLDEPRSPLHLARRIELPNVKGRIDHMALDPSGRHLFVAEYGNGTVDDVDLTLGAVAGRITGLHEPQGVAWLQTQGEIAVACGDGSVHFYRRSDLKEVAHVSLGDDADNVRIDSRNGNIVVGYGSGDLAVIDPATHQVIREVVLPAHPEAFELLGPEVLVNVPDAHEIAVGDLDQGRVTSTLNTGLRFGNYPMASDAAGSQIAVAYRSPGILSVMDARSGRDMYSATICGDADDLYFHAGSIIVVCGEGAVELVSETPSHDSVRVGTQRGARTGLLDPEHNQLLVAVPARGAAAAIWELSFR